jgi:hypothetical protein
LAVEVFRLLSVVAFFTDDFLGVSFFAGDDL